MLAKDKPLEKKIPKLIVKRRKNDNRDIDVPDIKTYIAHYINKNATIQAKSITVKNREEAIISFINEESLTQTESILKQKYTSNFKIERELLLYI